MTQEREAMEAATVLHEYETAGPNDPVDIDLLEKAERVAVKVLVSRHARSLQPITVEGLVAMGGVKSDEYIASGFIHVVQLGVLRFEFHPQHLVVRCGTYTGTPIFPPPTNMLHVHDLIERLSR